MTYSLRYVGGMMDGKDQPCPPQMLHDGQLLSFRWVVCGDETYRLVSVMDGVLTVELVRDGER